MTGKLNRRTLLGGIGALGTAGALPSAPANADPGPRTTIDFSDNAASLHAYVKLAGTIEDGAVHYWYQGTIFGMTPDGSKAMLGWTGLLKMVWRNLGNNSFHFRNFDLSYFTLPGSDERVEEFENPFTGKINRPIDVRGGPFDIIMTPTKLDWTRSGDDVWVAEPRHFKFANKLDPDELPLASTGENLNLLYVDGFQGKVSDLENPDIVSAPSYLNVHHVNPWYPFFLMGKQPGVNYWHGHGKKISSLTDVSPAVLKYIEEAQPGFIESEMPWPTRTDSYLQYKMDRQPIKD